MVNAWDIKGSFLKQAFFYLILFKVRDIYSVEESKYNSQVHIAQLVSALTSQTQRLRVQYHVESKMKLFSKPQTVGWGTVTSDTYQFVSKLFFRTNLGRWEVA